MAKYRKRPVEIEAQVVPELRLGEFISHQVNTCMKLAEWCGGKCHMAPVGRDSTDTAEYVDYIVIQTLEGDMKALPGDFVIRGVSGEFYPCKPEIFEKTYEHVEE